MAVEPLLLLLTLAAFVPQSLCVVYRSAPVVSQDCNTVCKPGVDLRGACIVFDTSLSNVSDSFGYQYRSKNNSISCVSPYRWNLTFSCLCAQSKADFLTIPLDQSPGALTRGDCDTTCQQKTQTRYSSFFWNASYNPDPPNTVQKGFAMCNSTVDTWGFHYETKRYGPPDPSTNGGFITPGALGPVLQDWNGSAYGCGVGHVNLTEDDIYFPKDIVPFDCLCAKFPKLDLSLANQNWTAAQIPESLPQGSHDVGAIVGGVIGGLAGVLLLAAMTILLIIRKRRRAAGSDPEFVNPWASPQAKSKPLWKQLLSYSTMGSCTTDSTGTDSSEPKPYNPMPRSISSAHSYFTMDVMDVAQVAQGAQTNYGLMKVQDLELLSAGTMTAALSKHVETSQLPPEPRGAPNTLETIAMVENDLPADLRSTWQISVDQLQLVQDSNKCPVTLGKGAYGTVYLGVLDGVRKVAVKIVNSPTQRHQKRFLQEIATLRACYDSNIVSFLGANVQEGNTLLVMEFMANGNLWDNLQNDSINEYRWANRGRKIALDIAAGMSFLHRNNIVHLDLKSPNVLLDENKKACVADIGLGKMMVGKDALASAATFFWAAPEQLQAKPVSKASDIFSLGVIIWEIITGEQPLQRVFREVRAPEECPVEVAVVMEACLSPEPADRPTIQQVYKALYDAPMDTRSSSGQMRSYTSRRFQSPVQEEK